ncbi:hypothetical protein [Gilliamella apicola]|nr:hypothetical protein [Gilliamella apicola]
MFSAILSWGGNHLNERGCPRCPFGLFQLIALAHSQHLFCYVYRAVV